MGDGAFGLRETTPTDAELVYHLTGRRLRHPVGLRRQREAALSGNVAKHLERIQIQRPGLHGSRYIIVKANINRS